MKISSDDYLKRLDAEAAENLRAETAEIGAVLRRRILRFAAALCAATALTCLATHYVRRLWLTLLDASVLVEIAAVALLIYTVRRNSIVVARICITFFAMLTLHFDLWDDFRNPLVLPIAGVCYAIFGFVALWPFQFRGLSNGKTLGA